MIASNRRVAGVDKVGDRLLITDITQTLYEQVTGWQEQKVAAPQLPPGQMPVQPSFKPGHA